MTISLKQTALENALKPDHVSSDYLIETAKRQPAI
jgi:hypothetical protein